jgi:hypothetical protein
MQTFGGSAKAEGNAAKEIDAPIHVADFTFVWSLTFRAMVVRPIC